MLIYHHHIMDVILKVQGGYLLDQLSLNPCALQGSQENNTKNWRSFFFFLLGPPTCHLEMRVCCQLLLCLCGRYSLCHLHCIDLYLYTADLILMMTLKMTFFCRYSITFSKLLEGKSFTRIYKPSTMYFNCLVNFLVAWYIHM